MSSYRQSEQLLKLVENKSSQNELPFRGSQRPYSETSEEEEKNNSLVDPSLLAAMAGLHLEGQRRETQESLRGGKEGCRKSSRRGRQKGSRKVRNSEGCVAHFPFHPVYHIGK